MWWFGLGKKRFNNSHSRCNVSDYTLNPYKGRTADLARSHLDPTSETEVRCISNPLHSKQKTYDFKSGLGAAALWLRRRKLGHHRAWGFYYGVTGNSAMLGLTLSQPFLSIMTCTVLLQGQSNPKHAAPGISVAKLPVKPQSIILPAAKPHVKASCETLNVAKPHVKARWTPPPAPPRYAAVREGGQSRFACLLERLRIARNPLAQVTRSPSSCLSTSIRWHAGQTQCWVLSHQVGKVALLGMKCSTADLGSTCCVFESSEWAGEWSSERAKDQFCLVWFRQNWYCRVIPTNTFH